MRFCFSFDHCFELDYCASLHSFGPVYSFIDSFLFFLDTQNYICFLMHFYFFFDPLPNIGCGIPSQWITFNSFLGEQVEKVNLSFQQN